MHHRLIITLVAAAAALAGCRQGEPRDERIELDVEIRSDDVADWRHDRMRVELVTTNERRSS